MIILARLLLKLLWMIVFQQGSLALRLIFKMHHSNFRVGEQTLKGRQEPYRWLLDN